MLMNAIMYAVIIKRKTIKMSKQITEVKNPVNHLQLVGILGITLVFTFAFFTSAFVSADRYQDQINALNAQNDQKKQSQGVLGVEASSLADAINRLQVEINASQARIEQLNGEITTLRAQIVEAEAELAKQKSLLGESIKAMYVSGEISTVEMLASSKDLSDFFDKQQYQESVRSKIKTTLDKVTQLKLDLSSKKQIVEKSLAEQQSLQAQLASQRYEKDRVLSLNQNEQNKLETEIKNNNATITDLRNQQIAENARLFSRNGGTIRTVPDTTGYPWANYRAGSWTHGGSCYYGDDIDPWGLCYRQCVSYVAWKVYKTKGYMPYGYGDAKNWDEAARADNIPVDSNPTVGSVAVSNYGTWGHVMFVDSINSNGTLNISQYNISLTGTYSEATISPNGLVFIHF